MGDLVGPPPRVGVVSFFLVFLAILLAFVLAFLPVVWLWWCIVIVVGGRNG